jgi:hypothetical protein
MGSVFVVMGRVLVVMGVLVMGRVHMVGLVIGLSLVLFRLYR